MLEEQLRPDAAETIEFMREQNVDLKLISGDARQTVTAVAHASASRADAGVIEGPELPADKAGLAAAAESNTIFCRITPDQKKALVGALGGARPVHGDDRRRRQRRPRAEAGAAGRRDGLGQPDHQGRSPTSSCSSDQFSMLPRAVGEGRRIARNIHRLGRLYATKIGLRRAS